MGAKFNLFTLIQRLETLKQRSYTLTEIAEGAGVSRATVSRIAANKTDRVDLDTLGRLARYFTDQGLPTEPGDLIVPEASKAAA